MLTEKTAGQVGTFGNDHVRQLTPAEISETLERLQFTAEEKEQLEIEDLVERYADLVKLVQSHPANFLAGTPKAVPATVQPVPVIVASGGAKAGLFGGASGQQKTAMAPKPSSEAEVSSQDWKMDVAARLDRLKLPVDSEFDDDSAPATSAPGR